MFRAMAPCLACLSHTDDTTVNFVRNGNEVYAVDAASGSIVASYLKFGSFLLADESKTSSNLFVAALRTNVGDNNLLTFDIHAR